MHCNGATFSPRPVLVEGLPAPAVQVAAGFASSLAVLQDGRVFAWGANFDGQLGNGSRSEQSPFPLKIPTIQKGETIDFEPLTPNVPCADRRSFMLTNSIKMAGTSRPQPVLGIFHPQEDFPASLDTVIVRADVGSSHCIALAPAEVSSFLAKKGARDPEEYDWIDHMQLDETLQEMYRCFPDKWLNSSELKKRSRTPPPSLQRLLFSSRIDLCTFPFPRFDFETTPITPKDPIDDFQTMRCVPEEPGGWRVSKGGDVGTGDRSRIRTSTHPRPLHCPCPRPPLLLFLLLVLVAGLVPILYRWKARRRSRRSRRSRRKEKTRREEQEQEQERIDILPNVEVVEEEDSSDPNVTYTGKSSDIKVACHDDRGGGGGGREKACCRQTH
eukprot:480431-Hanusia_phi.AAC.3